MPTPLLEPGRSRAGILKLTVVAVAATVAGYALVVVGVALLNVPASLVVAGAGLLAFGVVVDEPRRKPGLTGNDVQTIARAKQAAGR